MDMEEINYAVLKASLPPRREFLRNGGRLSNNSLIIACTFPSESTGSFERLILIRQ